MSRFVLPRLPDTWATIRLGRLAEIRYGKALPSEVRSATGTIDVYGSGGIVGQHNEPLHDKHSIVIGRKGSVGSVFQVSKPFWCIDTAYYLDKVSSEISLEYLGRYLNAINLARLTIVVGVPGLNREDLASVPVVLPTLDEQERIVELLRQADKIKRARTAVEKLVDELMQSAYEKYFSKYFSHAGIVNEVRIGKFFADVQYGISEAMEEAGTHAILRMNNLTTSGWLDLSDLKYAGLSRADVAVTELRPGDILFNRTNSRDLVGKCAIWREVKGSFGFASYLVRIRLKAGMLPEFVWATLNSPYGKFRLFNVAKQAVSMSNISPTDLARFPMPQPAIEAQEEFAVVVREIETLRQRLLEPSAQHSELIQLLQQAGISGELTREWRQLHRVELEKAERDRRAVLRKSGERISVSIREHAQVERKTVREHPARAWLVDQLSEFQHHVWFAIREWKGLVVPDDAESFADFCLNPETAWPIEHEEASPDRIKRTLEQLAALGLIGKVLTPTASGKYVTAFRPLRKEENTRLSDASRLEMLLKSETEKP